MKRLVRAQQQNNLQNQRLDPNDPVWVTLVNNTAKAIEQSLLQSVGRKLYIQDIVPANARNNFQAQLGMDLDKYVIPRDLLNLISQELGRDQAAYKVIQKYLLNEFRIYVNQHNQQVQQNPNETQ